MADKISPDDIRNQIFGPPLFGSNTRTFELTDPDEDNVRKFVGPGGEDLGSFYLISGTVGEDRNLQIPNDGVASIAFPTMAGIMRYVGPLQRGICMFIMHKVNRIVPTTPDLEKMVEVFDRHDSFDIAWALLELGFDAVLGAGGEEWVANLAVERGLAVRTKRGVRRKR